MINPYTVLNIPINSSIEDVKKAYKSIALKSHPDKLKTIINDEEKNKKIKYFIEATSAYNSIINNNYDTCDFNFKNYDFDNYENDYEDWIKTFNDIKNSNLFKGIIKTFINMQPKIRKHNISVDISYANYFNNSKKKLRLFLKGLIEPVFINLDCKQFPINIINYFDNNDNEHEITIYMNLINDININKGFYHIENDETDENNSEIESDIDNTTYSNEYDIDYDNIKDTKINIYYDMELNMIDYILGTKKELLFINKEIININIEPFTNNIIINNKGINGGDLIIYFKYIPIEKDSWNKISNADKKEMVRIFQNIKNDIKI